MKTDPFSGDDDRLKTRTVFALHHEYYHQATDETRFHRLMSVLIIVCAVLAATGAGMLGMKNVSTATTLPAIPASAALFILLAFFFRRWLRQIEVFVEFRADLYALFRTGGHVRRDSPAKGNEDRLMDRSYPRLKPWQAYLDSAGRTGTDQGLQTWLALALCASLAVIMLYSLPFPATSSGLDIVFAMAAAGLLTIAPGAGRAIASQMGEKATGRRFLLILFVVAPLVPFLLLRPVPDLTLLELGFALSLGLFTFGPALRQAFQ